ncbi:GNAT family N-acetyltransferase [Paenibacillus hunanensis]|uniref:GNAT family N-acetyltransferase n=1 Tax=Paenibacillus hunanensis TaxID=539262 RepID=UPI002A6AED66|nr:GNAT family N-acetyltransferase [Paenibacillus hunanensis]WPP41822.1 GNAT family N-acetyltransferase [Paenibacillus hunanensis]
MIFRLCSSGVKITFFCLANGWGSYRSSDELYNWWLRCIHNEAENFVRLGIVYDDTLIGYADLASIQGEAAELGIAIGDSRLWGKGLGCRAAMCIIQYASKQLKIIHFYAETDRSNIRSQKMLKKIGFEEISRSDQEQADHLKQSLIQYELHL